MTPPRRRLLSIAHSYVIGLNRRLPNEMARAGREPGRTPWDVTAVAPRLFKDNLRFATFEPSSDDVCEVRTLDVHFSRKPQVFVWGRGLRSLLREPWDLVHLWQEPYVLGGAQPALLTPAQVPVVFATFQNIAKTYPPPFRQLERAVLRRSAGWIAYGETIANAQRGRPGYDERPSAMIPPGVDVDVFHPDPEAGARVRRALGWEADGAPVIGYLGRLIPEKGLATMTRALDRATSPWRALIVGTGPLENELRAWGERHPGRVKIVTSARHHEVPAHLNAMDALLVPSLTGRSWREQFGRMVTEAFACGLPVVSSDSGELPFTVGDAGMVVGERDDAAWLRAIEELLSSPARRRDLSERGRRRAVADFAWPKVARQTLDFFDRLLA